MIRISRKILGQIVFLGVVFVWFTLPTRATGEVTTGPETEMRFPPLTVPDGFKATLFACDPLVEYPSVIAIGPQQGTLYVAYDYMTGLGVDIVKRDEVRLLSDSNNDGYADTSQFYAGGFNSIQGLAFHDGSVFVMHAPFLTSLRDTDGDGIADERRDLINGLGLPPEENSNRLHCANGVVVGHDGWLYLAMGDQGCDVVRPEGDRLLFQEGGILRCRRDGSDLHVFSSGLRNIYDIALDEDLNVFVRDNENDGGDYMIRVCRSFYGADHGYPYLYRDRPFEALLPLADLGRGSSAGGTAYLESAFPRAYRNSLYFCEWGRSIVRYEIKRKDGSFEQMEEADFAAGSPNDPYGFKPTDLVVDYDGSLLISDWCDGQRPKRGRGRIYRISVSGESAITPAIRKVTPNTKDEELIKLLNSTSHHQRFTAQTAIEHRIKINEGRGQKLLKHLKDAVKNYKLNVLGRLHSVWIIAHCEADNAIESLMQIANRDPAPRVQAQAVRAIADLTDPRFTGVRSHEQIAVRLAELVSGADPQVVLEVLVALGRLHWSDAPDWLSRNWNGGDSALSHAAMQLLRRSQNWDGVLNLLDVPDRAEEVSRSLRTLALHALAEQTEEIVVDEIVNKLQSETNPVRRGEYIVLLSRVYKKPAPWVYWGFRPEPRPANTLTWNQTDRISKVLQQALADADHTVRKLALQQMVREEVPVPLSNLSDWLRSETNSDNVEAILTVLNMYPADQIRPMLSEIVTTSSHSDNNRFTAINLFNLGITQGNEAQFVTMAHTTEDGPVLAAILEEISKRPRIFTKPFFLIKLNSKRPSVRAAALKALGRRKVVEASPQVVSMLNDPDVSVRRVAAAVAGELKIQNAAALLIKSADVEDAELCRASLHSLRQLNVSGAVDQAEKALNRSETQLAAINYLADYGNVTHVSSISKIVTTNRSFEVLTAVVRALANWKNKYHPGSTERDLIRTTLARVQSDSGFPILWSTLGPITKRKAESIIQNIHGSEQPDIARTDFGTWKNLYAVGTDAVVKLSPSNDGDSNKTVWLGFIELLNVKETQAQFLTSVDGTLQIWLNDKLAYSSDEGNPFQPNSDRFEFSLVKGANRLLVKLTTDSKRPRFHVRFRPKSSKAEHEKLIQLVLAGRGNAERGKELFANAEKSLCAKCHRVNDQGGKIGPDLTDIGSRFSRIYLIESILEPSRTVAPSYGTVIALLQSGKVHTGVKIAETPSTLTLGDKDGNLQVVARSEIDVLKVTQQSTMPEGLEKRMSEREITDLIAYLISLKKQPKK